MSRRARRETRPFVLLLVILLATPGLGCPSASLHVLQAPEHPIRVVRIEYTGLDPGWERYVQGQLRRGMRDTVVVTDEDVDYVPVAAGDFETFHPGIRFLRMVLPGIPPGWGILRSSWTLRDGATGAQLAECQIDGSMYADWPWFLGGSFKRVMSRVSERLVDCLSGRPGTEE